jgi:hypothetical protein
MFPLLLLPKFDSTLPMSSRAFCNQKNTMVAASSLGCFTNENKIDDSLFSSWHLESYSNKENLSKSFFSRVDVSSDFASQYGIARLVSTKKSYLFYDVSHRLQVIVNDKKQQRYLCLWAWKTEPHRIWKFRAS